MANRRRTDLRSKLADGVRRLRTQKAWSQDKCAVQAGLHIRHVQLIEAADVNVTLRTLEQLCDAFECTVSELFGEAEEHSPAAAPAQTRRK